MTSHTISYAKNSLEMQVSIHDLISRFPYFSAKFVGGRFQDSSIPSVTSLPWLTESAQPAFTHFISHGTLPNPTSKITSATLMILLELAEFLCSEELSTLSSSELSKKITKLLASKASVQDAKNGSLLCVKVLQFVRDRLGGAAVGAVLCSVFATTTSTNNFACLENLYLDTLKTLGSSWKTAWTHLATATSQQQREWLMERNPLSLTNKLQEDEDPMFIYDKQLTYIRSKVSAPLPIELKKCSNWCVAMDLVKIAIYSTSASSSLSSLLEYFAHHNLSTSFLTSANSKQTGVVELMALILHRHVCILSSRYLLHTCEHDQDFKRLFTRRGLDLSKDVETLSFIFNEHFLGEVCLSSPSSAVGILILVRSRFLPWAIEGNGGVGKN